MKSILWRLLNLFMAAVYFVAVYVQYNDPDPVVWMVLYAFPMILALAAAFGYLSPFALPSTLAYLALAIHQMPWGKLNEALFVVPTWHMISKDNEFARESVGLLICAAWMAVIGVAWWRGRAQAGGEAESR
ncbi:MAG: transmembrane 220 family protein [Candidatus Hydrogenedentes bacterium]|nr:transmembrane 220 family protein [Candidatus Hydrogenedentota bacterium]